MAEYDPELASRAADVLAQQIADGERDSRTLGNFLLLSVLGDESRGSCDLDEGLPLFQESYSAKLENGGVLPDEAETMSRQHVTYRTILSALALTHLTHLTPGGPGIIRKRIILAGPGIIIERKGFTLDVDELCESILSASPQPVATA